MDVDCYGCVLRPEEEAMSMAHMMMVSWMTNSQAAQSMGVYTVNVAMWQWFILAKIGYGWSQK